MIRRLPPARRNWVGSGDSAWTSPKTVMRVLWTAQPDHTRRPFSRLPLEAKLALAHESPDLPHSNDLQETARVYSRTTFLLFNVPMARFTRAVMFVGVDGWEGATWDEYHRWYIRNPPLELTARPEKWPVLGPGDIELVWDGWHRLHTYYARGERFVPVLSRPEALGVRVLPAPRGST